MEKESEKEPRRHGRRSVEREMWEKGWRWGEVAKLAKDKQQWGSLACRSVWKT